MTAITPAPTTPSATAAPLEVADLTDAFVSAFNAGDTATIASLYEPDGVLVPEPGTVLGPDEKAASTADLLALGVPIDARTKHVYVVDELAMIIVDWSMTGTAVDGQEVDVTGTAADVVRRGADGRWRYVVDNPFGTA